MESFYCEVEFMTKFKRCCRSDAVKGEVEVAFVVQNLIFLGAESVHL